MNTVDFIPLTEEDLPVLGPYFCHREERLCDWSLGIPCLWLDHYHFRYALVEGCLLLAGKYGGHYYSGYPIGDGDREAALARLETYCRAQGKPMRLSPTTPEQSARLLAHYPQAIVTRRRRDWDYLYRYEDLATFAGRHYSAQRNHIHRFEKACPDWQYRPIEAADIPAVEAFLHRFNSERTITGEEVGEEQGIRRLLEFTCGETPLSGTSFSGGLLLVEGEIAAFSLGEVAGDTLYVHVEKGDTRFPGVYQMMVREYARHQGAPGLRYINREDDAGIEGLRRSKLAYRPCHLLEKETVIVHL